MNKKPPAFKKPVFITKSISPKPELFIKEYEEIQNSGIFSNFGEKHNLLEKKLREYLKVKNLALFNNGTTALFAALKALNLKGEIITTPFTFPATVNAIKLANLTPVFCDIDKYYNIEHKKLEKIITKKASAILAVHAFGVPCNYREIKKIADKFNLKIIYDGAHAFDVEIDNLPIGTLGDISMFSFHATKIFNTIEGGCLCSSDESLMKKIKLYRNFGMEENEVFLPGLNGKMNEIQASIGLLNLGKVKNEIKKREDLFNLYYEELSKIKELKLLEQKENSKPNYQYLIIRLNSNSLREYLFENLKKYNIFAKKYFYPCAEEYFYIKEKFDIKNAKKASLETLALPLYGRLGRKNVKKICNIIKFLIENYEIC